MAPYLKDIEHNIGTTQTEWLYKHLVESHVLGFVKMSMFSIELFYHLKEKEKNSYKKLT